MLETSSHITYNYLLLKIPLTMKNGYIVKNFKNIDRKH